MLDTTGVDAGQYILVTGKAGALKQTTMYKILAKV